MLTALLESFQTQLKCHGPHAKLLKDISMRVKALKKIRDFLEQIFGMSNEDHEHIDSYK